MSLRVPLRVLLGLLLAAAPPVLALAIVLPFAGGPVTGSDLGLLVAGVLVFTLAWIAILTIVFTRGLAQETRSLVALAESGQAAAIDDGGTVSRRLADTLDERNRQVAELAARARSAPINAEPRIVAHHVVETARLVTRDPTWSLAVLSCDLPDLLPAGVYVPGAESGQPGPIDDLQQWASVSGRDDDLLSSARRLEGPWGAFVVVDVAAQEELRAILYAPWEGRAAPSAAELDLLSLLGQHAATALDHALLYARLRSQADAIGRMAVIQTDFLRGISHDLQTPLTSIRALAAELRSQPGLGESAVADLDLIGHQADRLRRLVGQLLAVSRLEAGIIQPQPEVLNPRPMVERTWAALRAADRPLELEVSGPPHLVIADPDRLEQVLWAILDNAVKYCPPGTPVEVRIAPDGDRATISITDHGTGMDEETSRRAFEQFFRAEAARRLAPDGSGIGLYAVRGLVEAMGGTVRIDSALGRGTTVVLELPAEPVEEPVG